MKYLFFAILATFWSWLALCIAEFQAPTPVNVSAEPVLAAHASFLLDSTHTGQLDACLREMEATNVEAGLQINKIKSSRSIKKQNHAK